MTAANLPKIKFLKTPTSQDWVEQAIAHLDTILLDHSHCERKAAGVAINLMFRYPSSIKLIKELTLNFNNFIEVSQESAIAL
jgi:Hydroxylase for synthesis of 2-methylthio-cis-ribozeatin in tRNA